MLRRILQGKIAGNRVDMGVTKPRQSFFGAFFEFFLFNGHQNGTVFNQIVQNKTLIETFRQMNEFSGDFKSFNKK